MLIFSMAISLDQFVEIYTVSQLNHEARDLLENNFRAIWIEGEISNLKRPSSGHLYFSLKDADAQVRCAMFRMQNNLLPFEPQDGMHVLMRARVSLYEDRGDFQLIVEHMEETGDGALRRAFEALKKRLAQEGLFEVHHKKLLPKFPQCIGVITSPTGAAIRDILNVLKRRAAHIPVIIYPTAVQGTEAAPQIVAAIQQANQRRECEVLILARGGGSLEDLWPFNEEIVARAVFACEIPVVSGVGHEIDFTIADFVADHRAPTPSAAAELVSPNCHEWSTKLHSLSTRLQHLIFSEFRHHNTLIGNLHKRLQHPQRKLQDQAQKLDFLERALVKSQLNFLQHKQQLLANVSRALDAVSPLNTLQRGYAIVTHQQKILQDAKQVNIGDTIEAKLNQGSIECYVTTIK